MLPSKTPPRRWSEITHPLESIFLKIQSQQREGGTKLYYCVVRLTYPFKEGDALSDLVPFMQYKKRENTHGGVLLLLKLPAKSLQL